MESKTDLIRTVVIGGGFAGLQAASRLARDPRFAVTLIDKQNHHTFQPLLYQVATAGLDAEDIGHSLRGVFHGRNVEVRLGEMVGLDAQAQTIALADGNEVGYDRLIIAAGAVSADFGIPGVAEHAFPLKSIHEALELRDHLLSQFERASADAEAVDAGALTFVIGGGGPTGVELAGAIAELTNKVMRKDFPNLDLTRVRVVLVDPADALLGTYASKQQSYAADALRKRGVDVQLGVGIARVSADRVVLSDDTIIASPTLIWAAGVTASPLAKLTGFELGRGGRIVVGDDLQVPSAPGVYVIGDLADARDAEDVTLPQLAPVAMQQGKFVAAEIARIVDGKLPTAFVYRDKGSMATIGRRDAVLELPSGLSMTGTVAWLGWLGLHLVYLIGFRNRLSVLLNWSWNYITYDRSARLILRPITTAREVVRGVTRSA